MVDYQYADTTKHRAYGLDPGPGRFSCYFWFVGWWAWSIGFHVSIRDPNIEFHIPFGFVRIGWARPG